MSTDQEPANEVPPEALMNLFHGPGFTKSVLLTVAVHAVLILGTSAAFLLGSSGDDEELTQEQRLEQAMKDATESLREIASQHGVTPQELSKGFAPRSAPPAEAPEGGDPVEPTPEEDPVAEPVAEPEGPKSAIEQALEATADGPEQPDLSTDLDAPEAEDLFQ